MALALLSLLLLFLLFFSMQTIVPSFAIDHMQRGFSATPDTSSSPPLQFQPLLSDATSNFSLGFLLVGSSNLDLAVVHVASSFPLWRAAPSVPFSWSSTTSLLFNGSLVLVDKLNSLSWSTGVEVDGDRLALLPSSNLQIVNGSRVVWQSFDFPSDSIVQDQNFTSKSTLVSSNQQYSMKLGSNFLALSLAGSPGAVYWKHTALETKAQIVEGRGPIYARLDPTGFLGLYQTERAPVDVISFDSFNSGIPRSLRRLTLEPDGNLREYYYSSSKGSGWVSEFAAVSAPCGLPSACGAYGLCRTDGGAARCECLDNRTVFDSGCFPMSDSGDTCGASGYWVLRRTGVELANKDLTAFEKVSTLEGCEGSCQNDCSCRGAVYSNTSGNCYRIEYPILTVVAVGDETKVGFFKVSNAVISGTGGGGVDRRRARVALVVAGVAAVLACGCGLAGFRVWRRRRRSRTGDVDGEMPEGMPYKGLSSASFRNIELTHSFNKG